jgi:hypothetical protein
VLALDRCWDVVSVRNLDEWSLTQLLSDKRGVTPHPGAQKLMFWEFRMKIQCQVFWGDLGRTSAQCAVSLSEYCTLNRFSASRQSLEPRTPRLAQLQHFSIFPIPSKRKMLWFVHWVIVKRVLGLNLTFLGGIIYMDQISYLALLMLTFHIALPCTPAGTGNCLQWLNLHSRFLYIAPSPQNCMYLNSLFWWVSSINY